MACIINGNCSRVLRSVLRIAVLCVTSYTLAVCYCDITPYTCSNFKLDIQSLPGV
jgi:hypothetical protein